MLLAILTRVIGMVATNLIKVHYNLCSSMSFGMLFLYCLINQIELLRALFNSQIVGNENKKPRVIKYIYIYNNLCLVFIGIKFDQFLIEN